MLYNEFSKRGQSYLRALWVVLFVGVTLAVFAFALSYLVNARQESEAINEARQISVTGEGKIVVKPDIALFTAAVITDGKRVGKVQSDNAENANAVIAFLKARGIEKKDIRTVQYSVEPQYEYIPCVHYPCPVQNPPTLVGYRVRNVIEVKVRDLDMIDDLLEGVVENGANEVGSVVFDVDNKKAVLADARAHAIADARREAKSTATALGVRLRRIVGFYESGGGPYYPVRAFSEGKGGDFGGPTAPQIEPGSQEIVVNVTVVYEFR